jgi:hypothetical protein
VRWESTGDANSYEIGAHNLFALQLASAPPGAVSQLQAAPHVPSGVLLTWRRPADAGSPPLRGYNVYRCVSAPLAAWRVYLRP